MDDEIDGNLLVDLDADTFIALGLPKAKSMLLYKYIQQWRLGVDRYGDFLAIDDQIQCFHINPSAADDQGLGLWRSGLSTRSTTRSRNQRLDHIERLKKRHTSYQL